VTASSAAAAQRPPGAGVHVLVADDQPDVRAALEALLGMDPAIAVVGSASSTEEVVELVGRARPDVVLLDVKMPGGGGIAATRTIRHRFPGVRVVALSAYDDRSTVLGMLRAGAVGYVTKGSRAEDIFGAVHRAAEGLSTLSAAASAELVHELGSRLRAEEREALTNATRLRRVRAAIDGGLSMAYQPVVDLVTGAVVGVESLARFADGRSPDRWFAEAEAVGLRPQLERAAFAQVLDLVPRLPDGVLCGVNLSPDVALDPALWSAVPDAVAARLVLELTEHAPVADYERLRSVLRPLQARGVGVAVDDAGAGFASLRHMLLLQADIIKIDASLTDDVARQEARRALAAALVSFAAETDAVVVAEGLERPEDLVVLRDLGVELGQGYLLGRPVPFDELDLSAREVVLQVPIAGSSVTRRHGAPEDTTVLERRLLRRLLRVSTPEQAVAELVGLVHDLGGRTVPAAADDPDALPVDLGLGVLPEPLAPAAPPGSAARHQLEGVLPTLVEDVRSTVVRLEVTSRVLREAVLDPLTGLLNRRGARDALRAGTEGDAVARVELDRVDRVCERQGRQTADEVLRAFGEALRSCVRERDVCWRTDCEGFALLLPATGQRTAAAVLQRVMDRWRLQRPLPVTISAGVALVGPGGLEEALVAADDALRRARSGGRNRIAFAAGEEEEPCTG
jgi:diguanylate cyclase (GGDEF)-like protein